MKFRSTIFLFVIGFALAAYLYFFERHNDTTREAADAHVVKLDRGKIDSISIKSPETKIELRKNANGTWAMEEPAKDRADSSAVAELLTAVETLRPENPIDVDPKQKEQLKEYGVIDSTTKARLTGGGTTVEVVVGKDTAIEGKSYVYVDGAKHVYAVDNSLKTQLQKKADDFRDRKLADLTPAQVTKAEIKSAAGGGTLELTKVNKHWTITKPLQARGDDAKVNDLLASALNAHIDDFGSEVNLATSGLSEPRGTVTFTQEGVEKPVVLSIGQNPKEEKDKEKTWARLSSRDALVLVPKAIEKVLESKPNDLRDRNLVRVESDIVDRITVEAAGAGKFVLGRKGETWVGKVENKDVAINDAIAPRILSDLQGAQVIDYVSDVATELPKYGLDQPTLKVTFSSYSSENTPETNAGEKPIVTVLFGKVDGTIQYAKVDDEPFIVTLAPGLAAGLPKSAIELQDLTIFNDKPEEVTALQVTAYGQTPLEMEKDKESQWKLSKGDGKLNQQAVTSLVTGLTRLHATRWLGAVKPEDGLDKPGVVVAATLTQGGQKLTRKVSLGAAKDDAWTATAEGKEGAFQIGRPDHDLLTAPLTDLQAAATPPPVGNTPPVKPMPVLPDMKLPAGLPPAGPPGSLTSPLNLTTPVPGLPGAVPSAVPPVPPPAPETATPPPAAVPPPAPGTVAPPAPGTAPAPAAPTSVAPPTPGEAPAAVPPPTPSAPVPPPPSGAVPPPPGGTSEPPATTPAPPTPAPATTAPPVPVTPPPPADPAAPTTPQPAK